MQRRVLKELYIKNIYTQYNTQARQNSITSKIVPNTKPENKNNHVIRQEDRKDIQEKCDIKNIRNFCIIAHIDHGKSTLSDMQQNYTGCIDTNECKRGQVLDTLEVERERGITVKAQTVTMQYRNTTNETIYTQNLIDCPGHIDFTYEVHRSMTICEGAQQLVDGSQGIQAQTLGNYQLARNYNLKIIPIITKIDLPSVDLTSVISNMIQTLDIDKDDIVKCSAKTGEGIQDVLDKIIDIIPSPSPSQSSLSYTDDDNKIKYTSRSLVFDSWYDTYKGVISLIKIQNGELKINDIIDTYSINKGPYAIKEIGIVSFTNNGYIHIETSKQNEGQVGYIYSNIRTDDDIVIGDTIYSIKNTELIGNNKKDYTILLQNRAIYVMYKRQQNKIRENIIPVYKKLENSKSMIYAGIYPTCDTQYSDQLKAVKKQQSNNRSVHITQETSIALGSGQRCGFLGMQHCDIFITRLSQEYNIDVILVAPTVPYYGITKDGERHSIDSPSQLIQSSIQYVNIYERIINVTIITPQDYIGSQLQLCDEYRGKMVDIQYHINIACIKYKLPQNEIIFDFYNKIQSITSGYASVDYGDMEDICSDIVKVDIRINGEIIDTLSMLCHTSRSQSISKRVLTTLKSHINRQNFEIILQAAIGNKVLCKERIPPYRKDVLTKSGKTVGGGDITRKKKQLEKQKEGKRRMRSVGNVEISNEAFLSAVRAQFDHSV